MGGFDAEFVVGSFGVSTSARAIEICEVADEDRYYSQAIVWPQMTTNVYAQGRVTWAGLVACLVGIGITIGEIIGGGVAKVRESSRPSPTPPVRY